MSLDTNNIQEVRDYQNIHYWLRSKYGLAARCEHCGIKNKKRYYWALVKGCKYEKNRTNFIELCASCHKKYDITPESIEKQRLKMIGRKASEETKELMSTTRLNAASYKRGWKLSQETRNKMSNSKKGVSIGKGKILTAEHRAAISNGFDKKITDKDYEYIMQMKASGMTLQRIGEFYNCCSRTVYQFLTDHNKTTQ